MREGQEEPEVVTAFEDIALLLAAIFPIVGRDPLYCLERERTGEERQVVLKTILGDEGYSSIGRLRSADENLAKVLSVAEYLIRSPRSLALLLEAAPYEALERAGVALARRLAQRPAEGKGSRTTDPGAEAEAEPAGGRDEKVTP